MGLDSAIALLQAVSVFIGHGALKPTTRKVETEVHVQDSLRIGVAFGKSHRKQPWPDLHVGGCETP